jgi:hypothetical protein
VSRLVSGGVRRCAVRVLVADADGNACGPVFVLARVTRLQVAAIGTPGRRGRH